MAKPFLRGGIWYSNFRSKGKRVRKALSPNKRTAEGMLHDMIAASRAMKVGLIPQNIHWSTFEERYRQYCATDKAKHTAYRDALAFRMMKDSLAITRLADVTPETLERLKFKWQERGKKTSAITRAIKSLKTAMRKAEEWGYIAKQDWRTVKVKESKGRLHYFSVSELEHLLQSCKGRWQTAILLMARNGLRSGEVWALHWEDVRFDLGKMHICQKPYWKPKGGKERWVRMAEDVKGYLKTIARPTGFVLGIDRPTLGSFQAYLARLIRNAGLIGSPHTLRHTFASHAVSNGASLPAIGEILGHSKPAMTAIYSHLSPQAIDDALGKLPVVRLWPVSASSSILKDPRKESSCRRRTRKREALEGQK